MEIEIKMTQLGPFKQNFNIIKGSFGYLWQKLLATTSHWIEKIVEAVVLSRYSSAPIKRSQLRLL